MFPGIEEALEKSFVRAYIDFDSTSAYYQHQQKIFVGHDVVPMLVRFVF